MVAKIIISKNIQKALNYNEQKVVAGKASCLAAVNYLKEADEMNFYEKLDRFTRLMALNERASTNTLHISLNFAPSEKPTDEKLMAIAGAYMHKIGFANQPHLIYRHHDAGHPHIHIVTCNIKSDGSRINCHNIGRNISEPARKEVETEFGLLKASGRNKMIHSIADTSPVKIVYGKSETKRSITNVLDAVINRYAYTSLAELNAVLKQFNVLADRGQEQGRIYKQRGLVYRILDEKGQKAGVPIKASSIYSKPTLVALEKKFSENEEKRKPFKNSLKERIDQAIVIGTSMQEFNKALSAKNIVAVLRRNEQGVVYGITYIDERNKAVFNGSDLGKSYAANAILQGILQRAGDPKHSEQSPPPERKEKYHTKEVERVKDKEVSEVVGIAQTQPLLAQLLQPEKTNAYVPFELKKKKKKKRRKPKL
ncbi:MAG: relaxase/mobilization nuclease domain-containing protein [Ginsengibacter sp.]